MKKKLISMVVMIPLFLMSCSQTLSDDSVQTVVSEAIMTSSSIKASEAEKSGTDQPESNQNELNDQLQAANLALTEQAAAIAALGEELEQVYLLLTPTETDVPTITPSPTVGFTATPEPTATVSSGLLYNQKYVITNTEAPLLHFNTRNNAGAPIMEKDDPVRKIKSGEKIIVDWRAIIGDGGGSYYLVQSDYYFGYYVRVSDVNDYLGP